MWVKLHFPLHGRFHPHLWLLAAFYIHRKNPPWHRLILLPFPDSHPDMNTHNPHPLPAGYWACQTCLQQNHTASGLLQLFYLHQCTSSYLSSSRQASHPHQKPRFSPEPHCQTHRNRYTYQLCQGHRLSRARLF